MGGAFGGSLVERFVRGSANPSAMWWIVAGVGFTTTALMVLYDRLAAARPSPAAIGTEEP